MFKISDIKVLQKVNFKKLKYLNLGHNKLSKIDIFKDVNFKELRELNLKFNDISDIKPLFNPNFIKLTRINLTGNEQLYKFKTYGYRYYSLNNPIQRELKKYFKKLKVSLNIKRKRKFSSKKDKIIPKEEKKIKKKECKEIEVNDN